MTELDFPGLQFTHPALLPPVLEYAPTAQHESVLSTLSPVYDVLAERYSTIRLPVVSKADSTIRAVLLQSKFTECSKEQLENAKASINTTVPGMSMLVRAVD